MAYLIQNKKVFEETAFNNEDELEKAVIENKSNIFGNDTVLLDYKRKIGRKKSQARGIPDGFLIDFSNTKNPKLFFIENELESHSLYEHIGPQIMRFYAAFETGKKELQKKLIKIIREDKVVNREVSALLKDSPFENVDAMLYYILYENNVGIIVVIDEQTEDFNSLLKRLHEKPEVVELKKYKNGSEIIYQYIPFRENVIISGSKKKRELIPIKKTDTIVCAAREEGFKHAFLDNDAWWAVRISPSIIPQLKYIAMYETTPISKIRWIAKIKENGIQLYKNTGKYIINVEAKKKITPIVLDKDIKGAAPQSPRYTMYLKVQKAKKVSELWYE